MQYTIIRRETSDELESVVNRYTAQGWEPLGPVGYSFLYRPEDGSPTALWYQALVKRR